MSDTQTFNIAFGKVTYAPGAPKNAPRWVWRCDCAACAKKSFKETVRGPFKTRAAVERDAAQAIQLLTTEDDGLRLSE
jgi:hypothetical protein